MPKRTHDDKTNKKKLLKFKLHCKIFLSHDCLFYIHCVDTPPSAFEVTTEFCDWKNRHTIITLRQVIGWTYQANTPKESKDLSQVKVKYLVHSVFVIINQRDSCMFLFSKTLLICSVVVGCFVGRMLLTVRIYLILFVVVFLRLLFIIMLL